MNNPRFVSIFPAQRKKTKNIPFFKLRLTSASYLMTYLSFKLIVEVWVIELNEAEEQGSFLGNGVVLGNLLLHIFLQEGHVA